MGLLRKDIQEKIETAMVRAEEAGREKNNQRGLEAKRSTLVNFTNAALFSKLAAAEVQRLADGDETLIKEAKKEGFRACGIVREAISMISEMLYVQGSEKDKAFFDQGVKTLEEAEKILAEIP